MKTHILSRLALVVFTLAALGVTHPPAQSTRAAGPWYVAPGASAGNSCLNPASPCATINGAIGKASSGDTVYVAVGTYTGTGTEVVLIDRDVTLSGGWDTDFVVQSGTSTTDGQGARRGITVNDGVTASVERFIVQNGDIAQQDGDGVYNSGTLTLNFAHIRNNANTGGGGGIYNTGTVTLNGSAVTGNGHPTLSCGGGIFNEGGSLTLNNSTVSGNISWTVGCAPLGGLANSNGTVVLNNVTLTGNTGGGIWSYPAGSTTLRNSIIAENKLANGTPYDCEGQLNSMSYNLIGVITSLCTITGTVGDQFGSPASPIDPKLGPLTGSPSYHPLLSGSPAIDAGNPAGCMGSTGPLTSDQRGAPRVGVCDIGAYEYTIPGSPASIYPSGGTPQRTPPFITFGTPLQAVVLDSIGTPVNDAVVTFSAPPSGASGTFANSGTYTTTAVTDRNGVVIAPTFAANGLTGTYAVTATVNGAITPATFSLSNFGWYIATTGNDANDCQTPLTPCATIDGVLGKPDFVAGDTALVAGGMYIGTGDQVMLLNNSVRLVGDWNSTFTLQDDLTIIDGQGVRKGIRVSKGVTARIEHFTIQNGSAVQGGGITLTGGGVYNAGTLILNDSLVVSNTAYYGAGIYNGNDGFDPSESGTLIVNNSAVISNAAISTGEGGGIYSVGPLTLNNSTVSNNSATPSAFGSGGGIFNSGVAFLNNSTVSANASARGGGILSSGALTLMSSTISANSATGSGSSVGGGGIVNGGTATLQNSILAGNTTASASVPGPDCSGPLASSGYNLIGDTSNCTFTPSTGDLMNVNARLFPLIDSPGYHPLLPSSPAIDAGNPAGCSDNSGNPLNTDQRGVARVGRCDIGAYEYDPNNDPLSYIFLPLIMK